MNLIERLQAWRSQNFNYETGEYHQIPLAIEAATEIERLTAQVEVLASLLERYRKETPLGHQPHMIVHLADAALSYRGGD